MNNYTILINTPFGQDSADLFLSENRCYASMDRGSADFLKFQLSDTSFSGVLKTDIPFECTLYIDSQINNREILGTILIENFTSLPFSGVIKNDR